MPIRKKKSTSVAVVDDHSLLRNAISDLVKSIKNSTNSSLFDIVIEAENGQDFVEKLLKFQSPVDIVILDIQMPIMDGFDTLKWINTNHPEIKVLVLTMHNDPGIVASFMKEGAVGYLTKDASKEKIETALKSITSKGFFYDDFITSSLITTLKKIDYKKNDYQNKVMLATKILTDREKEFLKLLGTELSYREIAEKMQVSPRTIDGYREELFRKLEVKSRVGLVMQAIKD